MLDFNRREISHEDELLLLEARAAAESDFEEEFTCDLIKRSNACDNFELTDRQRARLMQIAGYMSLGDKFDRE